MKKKQYKRLKLLVHRVNKERKRQAKKIDILCNDMITAHREFINCLDNISFAANFYESIIGRKDLDELFNTASELMESKLENVNIAFFLRRNLGFELYMSKEKKLDITDSIEQLFTEELVESVCKNNKVCSLDDLLALGLQINPSVLKNISAFTFPLVHYGISLGFILFYRTSENKIPIDELRNIHSIINGLAKAVDNLQKVCS